jgi:hypothetical protein
MRLLSFMAVPYFRHCNRNRVRRSTHFQLKVIVLAHVTRTSVTRAQHLSTNDRLEIFEQLNLHQRCIDNDGTLDSANRYVDLYWPECSFHVRDIRDAEFVGPAGLKQMYDYAHSVFPISKWSHSMGWFQITGTDTTAEVVWRWIVSWKDGDQGIVSTGTYNDRFEKRDGIWKCLERRSVVDPNWPAALFQPYLDNQDQTFKAS